MLILEVGEVGGGRRAADRQPLFPWGAPRPASCTGKVTFLEDPLYLEQLASSILCSVVEVAFGSRGSHSHNVGFIVLRSVSTFRL